MVLNLYGLEGLVVEGKISHGGTEVSTQCAQTVQD